jgi:hypothetical protein
VATIVRRRQLGLNISSVNKYGRDEQKDADMTNTKHNLEKIVLADA